VLEVHLAIRRPTLAVPSQTDNGVFRAAHVRAGRTDVLVGVTGKNPEAAVAGVGASREIAPHTQAEIAPAGPDEVPDQARLEGMVLFQDLPGPVQVVVAARLHV